MPKFQTGEKAPSTGSYRFVSFVDVSVRCQPTSNERVIPLSRGETFPPIRSCNASAWWMKIS